MLRLSVDPTELFGLSIREDGWDKVEGLVETLTDGEPTELRLKLGLGV